MDTDFKERERGMTGSVSAPGPLLAWRDRCTLVLLLAGAEQTVNLETKWLWLRRLPSLASSLQALLGLEAAGPGCQWQGLSEGGGSWHGAFLHQFSIAVMRWGLGPPPQPSLQSVGMNFKALQCAPLLPTQAPFPTAWCLEKCPMNTGKV